MITINIATLFSAAAFAFSFVSLTATIYILRANTRLRTRCLAMESGLAAVRREAELVASISVRTGRQVKRMENEFSGVAERVDVVEQRGPSQSFDQAIDSARRGEDAGVLTAQFGLSRGEAELVTRLHGRQRRA